MEVDENYDDDGEEEKKGPGPAPNSASGDGKTVSPGVNGHSNGFMPNGQGQPKLEGSA